MLKKILYPKHIEHSLKIVKQLQTEHPTLIIGGSVALYLHGVRVKRFKNWDGDLDFINPTKIDIGLTKTSDLPSNCDFQEQGKYDGIKVDLRFDSEAKFEEVIFNGSLYKVALLEEILKFKCGYGREKDKLDIREMLKLI